MNNDSRTWTTERLKQLIDDCVEESLTLEYKRAASLSKSDDRKKMDVVKQVSAMANASGGTIIYGIAEFDDKEKRHLPEKRDPIDRSDISKEWLDSIILSIQPRIDGVRVHPVTDDDDPNKVFYVVEVPQSYTAHQARDHVYYKRRNFQVQAMEDYEVRDVMNRKSHPRVKAWVKIYRPPIHRREEGKIFLKLENASVTICLNYMAILEVPIFVEDSIWFGDKGLIDQDEEAKTFWRINLSQNLKRTPLFPGATLTLSEDFEVGREIRSVDDSPLISGDMVRVTIYADEMPAIRCAIPLDGICEDWIEVKPIKAT